MQNRLKFFSFVLFLKEFYYEANETNHISTTKQHCDFHLIHSSPTCVLEEKEKHLKKKNKSSESKQRTKNKSYLYNTNKF